MCDNDNPNATNRRIFDVPLSVQRYVWVQKYIENDTSIRSVSDFGCGNGRITNWLKSIPHLERINFIDVDSIMLEDEMDRYFSPTFYEMLFGRQNSDKQLNLTVYHGAIAIPDDRLSADCFILVEVIEHMSLDDVDRAVKAIFGYYQPKTVIFTTPNSEFNHLLRSKDEPVDKFRHFDHKFEWTRAQFLEWVQKVCNQYPYTHHIDGVGHLPNSEPYGPCTQIAVFKLIESSDTKSDKKQKELLFRDLMPNKLQLNNNTQRQSNVSNPTFMDPKEISELRSFQLPGMRIDRSVETERFDWSTLK